MTHHDDHIPGIAPAIGALGRLIHDGERATVIGLLITAGLSDERAASWYDEARRRYVAWLHSLIFTGPPDASPVQPIWGPR